MTEAQAKQATQEFSLSINRTINAPIEKVYRAWTEVEMLSKWFGPFNVEVVDAKLDLVVGGKYRIEMQDPDGNTYIHVGEYKVIEPEKILVFTWNSSHGEDTEDDTCVTIKFATVDAGTQIQLIHEHFADSNSRDMHNQGWESCFDNMEARLFSK